MKHKGLRKRMDTATFIISILSMLFAGIAALYGFITFQLSKKIFKFSLFDKRYETFLKIKDAIQGLNEWAKTRTGNSGYLDIKQATLEHKIISIRAEILYLYGDEIVQLYNQLLSYLDTLSATPQNIGAFEEIVSYTDHLLSDGKNALKRYFNNYLLDNEFRKPEPYSIDESINKFFGC